MPSPERLSENDKTECAELRKRMASTMLVGKSWPELDAVGEVDNED